MKNIFFKIVLPVLIISGAIVAIGSSCSDIGGGIIPPPGCNIANSDFKQLYNYVSNNPSYTNNVSMDLQTHEYKFKTGTNSTICKVGYEGNAALYTANIPYTIEIADASGTILYTGSHRFASGATDYQALNAPVNISAGQVYTIRRIMSDPSVSLDKLQGRVLYFNNASGVLPALARGILEITGTNYYGRGGPIPNRSLAYIDIVFQ